MPLGHARFPDAHDLLVVAMRDMHDFDLIQRLGVILNRNVPAVEADSEQLEAAINRRYGQSKT